MTQPRKNVTIAVDGKKVVYRVPAPLADYLYELQDIIAVEDVTKIARNLDEMHFHVLEQERDEAIKKLDNARRYFAVHDDNVWSAITEYDGKMPEPSSELVQARKERDEARAWAIYFRRKCKELQRELDTLYMLRKLNAPNGKRYRWPFTEPITDGD